MQDNVPSLTAALVAKGVWAVGRNYEGVVPPQIQEMYRLFVDGFISHTKNMEFPESQMANVIRETSASPSDILEAINAFNYRFGEHSTARKHFIETQVSKAIEKEGVEQVIVAGGGFDTLSIRGSKDFPDVKWIEHDHPATQKVKLDVIANNEGAFGSIPNNLTFINHDLRSLKLIDALPDAGYDPSKKALFIFEGVLLYLPKSTVQEILQSIEESSPKGSKIIMGVKGANQDTTRFQDVIRRSGESINFTSNERDIGIMAAQTGFEVAGIAKYEQMQSELFLMSDDVLNAVTSKRSFYAVLENLGRLPNLPVLSNKPGGIV